MIPHPYIIFAALLLVASAYGLGRFHGASGEREKIDLAKAHLEARVAKAETQAANESIKVVTEYVDRIQKVEVRVPVVRERLVRVCNQAGSGGLPSSARNPHAPPAGDAANRSTDQLASDLLACRRIKEQCQGLIDWKKGHGG